jgi:hypothetical protein
MLEIVQYFDYKKIFMKELCCACVADFTGSCHFSASALVMQHMT